MLKKPTLNIGRFIAGDKVNIVAGFAFFELDIRYLPSMNKEKIIKDLKKIINKQKVKHKIRIIAHQRPIEINKDTLLIKTLKKTLQNNHIKSKLIPSFGATVINFLKDRGIETFAFGFGTKGCAHAKNEYVKANNLYKGVRVLEEYIKNLDKYVESKRRF